MKSAAPDFRALFESAPGLYLVLTPHAPFKILAASNDYLAATMTSREAIMGRDLFEVFPDNPNDPDASGVRNLRTSLERVVHEHAPNTMAVQKYDIRRPQSEGGGFEAHWWSPVNSPVLGPSGELAYIIHRVEDVTAFVRLKSSGAEQQKLTEQLQQRATRMESEIYQRAQEIQEANRKLSAANEDLARLYARSKALDEIKTQFLATISHELRTPLTLILGPASRLLESLPSGAATRRDLEVIVRNARTLLHHVDELLDVSKREAGSLKLAYADADLAHIVSRVASQFATVARDRHIVFTVDAAHELRGQVDPDKLARIVVNLVANAFKFTPEGGRIRIAVGEADAQARIEVADSGPGIPADQRETIFERFRQLERGPSHLGGIGLGLAIARDLAVLHGGTITVDDAPEGGARFMVALPRWAPVGTAVRAESPELAVSAADLGELAGDVGVRRRDVHDGSGDPSRALILVAEDNPDMNRFICESLAHIYRVAGAFDGRDALAKSIKLAPDLIVTDLIMADMGGDDLTRAVRKHSELDTTPIIVLTASTDDELRVRLLREGAQDYLTKPFLVEELRARVDALVARKRAEQESHRLSERLKSLADASMAVSEALANLPETSIAAVLKTIALQAQALTGAQHVAVGLGTDPDVPFEPWVVVGFSDSDARAIGHPPRPVGVLGAVIQQNTVIRMRDVRQHPAHRGYPPHHPQMKSFLGVPISYRGQSVGNLYLTDKRGADEFTDQDEQIVKLLAARAGVAIETARLYQQAGAERAWLKSVIDQMPEAVVLMDASGRVTTRNGAVTRFACEDAGAVDPFGNPIDFDLRFPTGEPVAPPDLPAVRALNHQEVTSGCEYLVRLANDSFIPVLVSAGPIRDRQDNIIGATMIVEDISAIKEVERLREEWASIIAHDLRQPVNTISLATSLLNQMAADRAELAKPIARIQAATVALTRMIDDLLDASRLAASRMTIELRDLDLAPVIDDIIERMPGFAVRTVREVPPGIQVSADRGRLEQVLTNLLSNAVKYGEPDTPVRISVRRRDGEVEVSIANRGQGIAAHELSLLFSRFARTRAAEAGGAAGVGLGLYICKGLIEAMGGRIWAESEPDGMTVFRFTLLGRGS